MKTWLLRNLTYMFDKFRRFLKRLFKKRKVSNGYEIVNVGRKNYRVPAELVERYKP
jgi:hypothetical protein